MKKLVLVFCVLLTACSAVPPTQRATETPATATPLVLPQVTKTVVPTATPVVVTPTPSPTPAMPEVYIVQPGDTLASIAGKFGLDMNDLALANKLGNPNMIFPGDVLVLKGKLYAPDETAPVPTPDITSGKEIVVVLHTQRTYAFEDGVLQKTFVVSTGVARYPTVTGHYSIYEKDRYVYMTDHATYWLPNVPYVSFFYEGYSLHGTYWHHNFGHPMSHGCVNMQTDDAQWIYEWAPIGTVVWVIP